MIRIKHIDDSAEAADGLRLLVAPERPHVKMGEETWEQWWRALAPSLRSDGPSPRYDDSAKRKGRS